MSPLQDLLVEKGPGAVVDIDIGTALRCFQSFIYGVVALRASRHDFFGLSEPVALHDLLPAKSNLLRTCHQNDLIYKRAFLELLQRII